MENSLAEDYVTEKVYDALAAGCLPIYYGAPNIGTARADPSSAAKRTSCSPSQRRHSLTFAVCSMLCMNSRLSDRFPTADCAAGSLLACSCTCVSVLLGASVAITADADSDLRSNQP